MLKLIITKTLRELFRLKSYRYTIAALWTLLFIAIVSMAGHVEQLMKQQADDQQAARKAWEAQPAKNPHSAAHYGSYAFRKTPQLAFFDPGIELFAGNSVYLEAHKENDALFSRSQQASSDMRLGELSPAMIIYLLLPLLLIFIGYGLVAAEREQQTLKLLLVHGTGMRQIIFGKTAGLALAGWIPVIPVLLFGSGYLLAKDATADTWMRWGILHVSWIMYILLVSGIIVFVSAWVKTSRSALLVLLSAWCICTLILPKILVNVAEAVYPLPSHLDFHEAITFEVRNGPDGHRPQTRHFEEFKQRVLKKYGVDSVSQLPVNLNALNLQEGEEYTNAIHDKYDARITAQLKRQDQVSFYAGLINPYLAMKNLSMQLSATDIHAYLDFRHQAENYRRSLIRELNMNMANHSRTGDFDYKVDKTYLSSLPDFAYQPPKINDTLLASLLHLTFTLTVTGLLIFIYSAKIKP